jgi:chromosome segregation ATPase
MAEKLTFDIQVGGNQDQALGSLKAQLKEATQEVQKLSDKFGATSEQAIQAAKRAAELKDQIGDAATLVDAFNPDTKFKALSQTLGTVAGGFAAVQGALGLIGSEGEDVQKTLAKVQSALALSQGLEQLGDLSTAFSNVKSVALDTFKGIKTAIGSTGIGILLVSLGLLVANFDKVKEAVSNLIPGLKQIGTFFGNIITKVTDFVGITSKAERALAALEKTTKRGNESIEARIKILTAQVGKEKEIYELSKQQGDAELNALRQRLSTKGKLTEEEQKRFRDLGVERQVLDAQENKRRQDAAQEAADKSKQLSDKLAEEEANRLQKQIDDERKHTDELLSEYDKRRNIAKNAKILTQKELKALDEAQAKEDKDKQAKIDNERIEGQMKVVATTTNFTLQAIQTQQKATADSNQNINNLNKWLASEDKKRLDAKVADTESALTILSAIIDQNSVAGKAIAVAQAIINTYQGATRALGQGGVLGFVGASAVIAAGLVNVKKIVSTNIPSAKGTGTVGGGASAPSLNSAAPIAPPQPQAQTTSLDNRTINAIGNQAVRAYVIENDVTSNQQRIAAIKQRARFG